MGQADQHRRGISDDTPDFERHVEGRPPSLLREFGAFLLASKKWWLLPILLAFLVIGLLIFLAGTGLAPFIYTLF